MTGSGMNPSATKKPEGMSEPTPLEKMLKNAGPIRPDGSDKFFGMENV
jgi:ubiquitin carboxyl-terminal hydrolase 9/13